MPYPNPRKKQINFSMKKNEFKEFKEASETVGLPMAVIMRRYMRAIARAKNKTELLFAA